MSYFLVDYENVHETGFKHLNQFNTEDTVVLFYSDACKNISLDIIHEFNTKHIVCMVQKVNTGTKNALDFQLSSYLGYLIGHGIETKSDYYIVSNDKGFDCVCEYWQHEKHINVTRIPTATVSLSLPAVVQEPAKKTSAKKKIAPNDMATSEEINQALNGKDNPKEVLSIFNKYKTKQAIVNGLSKLYRNSKKTSSVYKKLKPLFKGKHKT